MLKSPTSRAPVPARTRSLIVLALGLSALPSAAGAAAGLTAGYAFSEGSGTTTADSSGNAIAGALVNGPVWTTARNGTGLSLDGSGTYVNLGNLAPLRLTGSMTLSAWVYETENVFDDGQIVAKSDGGSGWQLKSSPDTGVRTFAIAITGSNGAVVQRYSTGVRALNTWYFVAGVYDAGARTLAIYVNGNLANGVLTGLVPSSQRDSPASANIGRRTGGFTIRGIVDDVRIYGRALAPLEIQADMGTPVGGSGGADTTAPSVPGGLAATAASSSQVDLSWGASTDNVGVAGYRIYRNGALAGTTATTSFGDTGLGPNTTYAYAVTAYDAAGNVSALSSPVSGSTLPDVSAPSIPAGLTAAVVSARRIDLAWSASTDNVGATAYEVYRDDVLLAIVNQPGYSDAGLQPASVHSYAVTALDAAGNVSPRSLPASATTLDVVAVAPASVTAAVGSKTTFSCTLDDPLDSPCVWSVQEGGSGGAVTATGATSADYTAPGAPATYHVVATGASDPTRSGTATVNVVGAGTPELVQSVSSSTNPVGVGIPGNDFKFTLPNAVLAGNALVLKVAHQSGVAFSDPPITDSNGNLWPTTPSASVADANGNVDLAVFVLPDARPGVTTLTVHFVTSIQPFQYDCSEWRNIALSSPLNGSRGASRVAGPTVSAGAFTPGSNDELGGNLVLYYIHTDDNPGSGNSASSIVAGSGFTLLDADIAWGTDTNSYQGSAFQVQSKAAPINPSLTVTTAPGTEHFVVLAIALKVAAAGTAPLPGIRIVKVHHFTNELPPTTWNIQFPTTGSTLVVAVTPNAPGDANTTITNVTDNHGNTYLKTEPADDQPQWWVAEGAATASDTKLTFHMNSGSAGISMRIFEITGAATSGVVDSAAGMSATDCSSLTSIAFAPTITPASANGLTIATMGLGQGPGLSATAPAGALFDLVTYTDEVDTDTMENADAMGHVYNATPATQNWAWTFTSRPSNTCYASAIHLRAQ